ncbi:uncharacterized protein LOC144312471 [Canis aureus]
MLLLKLLPLLLLLKLLPLPLPLPLLPLLPPPPAACMRSSRAGILGAPSRPPAGPRPGSGAAPGAGEPHSDTGVPRRRLGAPVLSRPAANPRPALPGRDQSERSAEGERPGSPPLPPPPPPPPGTPSPRAREPEISWSTVEAGKMFLFTSSENEKLRMPASWDTSPAPQDWRPCRSQRPLVPSEPPRGRSFQDYSKISSGNSHASHHSPIRFSVREKMEHHEVIPSFVSRHGVRSVILEKENTAHQSWSITPGFQRSHKLSCKDFG